MPKKDYLIIDRSKWRTGTHGKGDTFLLNNEGYMCCLGFRCEQMGIPKKDLRRQPNPVDLGYIWYIPGLMNQYGEQTSLTEQAISINDHDWLTDYERETQLTKLFDDYGITVEFIGEYNY